MCYERVWGGSQRNLVAMYDQAKNGCCERACDYEGEQLAECAKDVHS